MVIERSSSSCVSWSNECSQGGLDSMQQQCSNSKAEVRIGADHGTDGLSKFAAAGWPPQMQRLRLFGPPHLGCSAAQILSSRSASKWASWPFV